MKKPQLIEKHLQPNRDPEKSATNVTERPLARQVLQQQQNKYCDRAITQAQNQQSQRIPF